MNKHFFVLLGLIAGATVCWTPTTDAKLQSLSNPSVMKVRDAIAQAGDKVVLQFSMVGCPPCNRMAPIVRAVANELGEEVVIVKVTVANSQSVKAPLKSAFGFSTFPRFFYYKDGKRVGSSHGSTSKATLRANITKHLGA